MRLENIELQVRGTTKACLQVYLIDPSEKYAVNERPMIILCPGGRYEWTSDREAEVLALQFLAMGYHAAVLRYSVAPAVYPTQLLELAQAVWMVKKNAVDWHVLPEKIFVEGSSAGGHVAASLGVNWSKGWLLDKLVESIEGVEDFEHRKKPSAEDLRPAGLILSYPVITSGPYAHRGSFENLLKGIETEELLEEVSLEKQVNDQMPPVFIWHTYTDGAVPVENSLLFVMALREHGISTEFHMYPVGGHGVATGKEITASPGGKEIVPECTTWLPMVETWLKNICKKQI